MSYDQVQLIRKLIVEPNQLTQCFVAIFAPNEAADRNRAICRDSY